MTRKVLGIVTLGECHFNSRDDYLKAIDEYISQGFEKLMDEFFDEGDDVFMKKGFYQGLVKYERI